ncbi:MAG: esterase-like activity of phytase family protein [Sphingomonadaceae bacterium]
MAALALLLLLLTPGTGLRSSLPEPDYTQKITFTPLLEPSETGGNLALLGAWNIDSTNTLFGGFSSLVTLEPGRLLSASDRGNYLEMSSPQGNDQTAIIGRLGNPENKDKIISDIESLTRDPDSAVVWAGFELSNTIHRFGPDLKAQGSIAPLDMAHWWSNSGPEAMTRLPDGRFIVLSEGATRRDSQIHDALLFPSDPLDGGKPVKFSYQPPSGYDPVDMALLPDGKVLILLRKLRYNFPPGFETALSLADPGRIAADSIWTGEQTFFLAPPVPPENYEGLTVDTDTAGRTILWIISDDNTSIWQRTLLLKLLWQPEESDDSE